MNFRIPIYVFQHTRGYTARPLFASSPERTDANLNRLLTKLTRELITQLERLGREKRHDEVATWAFCPRVTAHRVPLEIELRRRIARVKYLVVAFDHMGRRLAFTPAIPDVWFEVTRNEPLELRAQAVLTDHWRQAEREADEEEQIRPEETTLSGKAWVQVLDLSVNIPSAIPTPPPTNFLMLGGSDSGDGASELRRVGRCLDWLYPDELERAILRNREVTELERLLGASDRRPVLLCGPRMAGKTAIVHECVARRVAERKQIHIQKENLWLISPQRLISGMSYVGQWEGRLLAILKHAKWRDHVLYFDDLIGLFLAGITGNSSLSAAIVLKPYLERRDVRVLGEISPEGLRILQERDRGFADLFHLIPVREPTDADTLRILVDQQRRLEGKHTCNFGLDVLPTTIDLQRRYDRTAAFPGKAATVLNRLAVRATAKVEEDLLNAVFGKVKANEFDPLAGRALISRDDVLADFASRSGLSLAFFDPKERLDRDDVRDKVREQVIGQSAAVEAMADVVSIAKARLNDPERPLAAFLFLGPTGVGKTECAKAIARTLFGDADRLLRFDLNEFNQPGSATRLVGTFSQPEGLLTSAIQRQPFAVILLDEIEKADPEVFDLLLSVLGEGRLTDALGRTANFSNAIIILTSNLGVREAEGSLGFATEEDRSFAYTKAAEKFFRPEFFNRLDRVIPFKKLDRNEMATIARRLVNEVLAREGFGQRKCVLNVSPDALDRVIAAGYDPALGARAMKRAVERELTQPAASKLAELSPDELTVVTVQSSDNRLTVSVQAPGWAKKVAVGEHASLNAADRIVAAWESLDGIAGVLDNIRPKGSVVSGKVLVEHERYFALKELSDAIGETLNEYENRLADSRLARLEGRQPDAIGRKARYRAMKVRTLQYDHLNTQPFRSLSSATSMEEALQELFDTAEPIPDDADLFEVENKLALLRLMATAPPHSGPVYLWIRGFPEGIDCPFAWTLADYYAEGWKSELGVEMTKTKSQFEWDYRIEVKGVHARSLALSEAGTHLFLPKHGGPVPVRVDVCDSWPPQLADPFAFGPILRIYPEEQPVADVRTGLVSPLPGRPEFADAFRTFTLAALPRAIPE
ncbi:MAG TPA: AAA family ATPase [Gemmata sp.]|jgi:ATP-dependent Clp protease ATP-binding subunit ClpA|nr:AAA family ATPase [Gemmata sp.]